MSKKAGPVKMPMLIAQCPKQELALTNCVFLHKDDFVLFGGQESSTYIKIVDYVYVAQANAAVQKGQIALNQIQRRQTSSSLQDSITVESFVPVNGISNLTLEVGFSVKNKAATVEVDHDPFVEAFVRRFKFQVFRQGQELAVDWQGFTLLVRVATIASDLHLPSVPAAASDGKSKGYGVLVEGEQCRITVTKEKDANLRILNAPMSAAVLDKWDFESMGIGGLDKESTDIFRRSFASRFFPPAIIKKLGISHVRGMLLHGPPGTGKTLIARKIGKLISNSVEPKIVNGPEILNKYVGASEENIRKLFADAEADAKANGDAAHLHIIIFDEIDAICKQRGSNRDGTGVHDTVVNQLLSKIDGVDSLNNILVIGMTNRKDLIDEALLRPGRLEVHVEIGLPDEQGRLQILRIHTSRMREHDMLMTDVNLNDLATDTKNFSGAEIEGLVKSAASFALQRNLDPKELSKGPKNMQVKVGMGDFRLALGEIRPAYGVQAEEFQGRVPGGLISYGQKFEHLRNSLRLITHQLKTTETLSSISILLEGPAGTGKTALAAQTALEGEFPFSKFITPENLVGYSELSKCNYINKTFDDAAKSPLSVIVLDDIERLLEYVAIGPRFSNLVLQTLLVMVKRAPPKGKKLLIIGTTSCASILDTMDLLSAFNIPLSVTNLGPSEVRTVLTELNSFSGADLDKAVAALAGVQVGIKKLLLVLEMAREEGQTAISYPRFLDSLHDCSLSV
mmetsp:Transcript_13626/g.23339  ORF Transcript_13626/g.23339 Transcript_13626/m.23339 type:complete len:737 (+) Transcript_13626:205-2415(+)